MRVYLINPSNPVVSLTKSTCWNKLNKYRVWKPLGLLTLARLTPDDWELRIIDENLGPVDYEALPRPDLVGLTAFTSQATRAYELAREFRNRGVPTVIGGIHASMCVDEALRFFDAVVTGEAERQWGRVLEDVRHGRLQRRYEGGLVPVEEIPPARHDLLPGQYYVGSVQTTRGCPLRCTFCSVTAFNGGRFRHRPIENVLEDLRQIREKIILFVDDNLIGTRKDHVARTKELFRAMIREKLTTPWICQATINFADDEELLELARRAGCIGVFIGFESATEEGLVAVHKKFNIQKGRDFRRSVRCIQQHGIHVTASFIIGIDTDGPGASRLIAEACEAYGVGSANLLVLTPLPGTELYREMEAQGRILACSYPHDWRYYTLSHPVAAYKNFNWRELVEEVCRFHDIFYGYPKIVRRVLSNAAINWRTPRNVFLTLIANLTYRYNHLADRRVLADRLADDRPVTPPILGRADVSLPESR